MFFSSDGMKQLSVIITFVIMAAVLSTATAIGNVNAQMSDGSLNGNAGNGGPDNTQPGRVGSHDDASQTSPTSNPGNTVSDPTITGDPTVYDPGDTITKNCFGKVIQHRAQEHKENPDEGTLGSHASDPVPELPGNETPRQGIGNQDQGHPAAHGAFNSQFDPDDAENVSENCTP